MSDLIRREDAIEAMKQRYDDILRTFKRKIKVGEKAIVMDMIGCVKALPSADRPKGEWREEQNWRTASFYSVCSECGYFDDERDDLTAYNFCPYCGAKMKGADDES